MNYKNYTKTSQLFGSCRRYCANVCNTLFFGRNAARCFRDCLACRDNIFDARKKNLKKK